MVVVVVVVWVRPNIIEGTDAIFGASWDIHTGHRA